MGTDLKHKFAYWVAGFVSFLRHPILTPILHTQLCEEYDELRRVYGKFKALTNPTVKVPVKEGK